MQHSNSNQQILLLIFLKFYFIFISNPWTPPPPPPPPDPLMSLMGVVQIHTRSVQETSVRLYRTLYSLSNIWYSENTCTWSLMIVVVYNLFIHYFNSIYPYIWYYNKPHKNVRMASVRYSGKMIWSWLN